MDAIGGRRRGPVPLVVTGPLSPYESLVRTELVSWGYAAASVRDAVLMMRRLSLWMDRRELVAAGPVRRGWRSFCPSVGRCAPPSLWPGGLWEP